MAVRTVRSAKPIRNFPSRDRIKYFGACVVPDKFDRILTILFIFSDCDYR